MKASLKSSPTNSGYSSERKRKSNDRQLAPLRDAQVDAHDHHVPGAADRGAARLSSRCRPRRWGRRRAGVAGAEDRVAVPVRGKPARRVVDTAAGLELGGIAEKTARRTTDGSTAMARASGVAEGLQRVLDDRRPCRRSGHRRGCRSDGARDGGAVGDCWALHLDFPSVGCSAQQPRAPAGRGPCRAAIALSSRGQRDRAHRAGHVVVAHVVPSQSWRALAGDRGRRANRLVGAEDAVRVPRGLDRGQALGARRRTPRSSARCLRRRGSSGRSRRSTTAARRSGTRAPARGSARRRPGRPRAAAGAR